MIHAGFGDRWVTQLRQLGKETAPDAPGEARAVCCSFSGRRSNWPLLAKASIADCCSVAASRILFTLAMSQFIARLAPFRMALSTFVVMMSMAATGAPSLVSRSSICSLCLK